MAAPSPRKPHRTKGRHRKPSKFDASNCAHWLGVGAVGFGLAAAVAGGQATASATTDGSSNAGPARANSQDSPRSAPGSTHGKAGSKRQPASNVSTPTGGDTTVPPATVRPGKRTTAAVVPAVVAAPVSKPVAIRIALPPPDALKAVQGAIADAISQMQRNLSDAGAEVLRSSARIGDHIRDEITSLTGEFAKLVPAASSAATPAAAKTATASDAPVGSPAHFVATIQAILSQLVGWPEPPNFTFTTPANYTLEQALDAHSLTIDFFYDHPTPATRWMSDLMRLVHLFLQPIDPAYTFSDGLNVLGSLLNRLVPPYKIKDPQSATLTKAQVAAAAVGALVKVLDELLAGDFNPEHWRDAATEGGTLGATDPGAVLNMTFNTSATPNLFSLMCYTALVAVYDRYKWVALDHLPVATPGQTGQLLLTVSGNVNATDADDDPLVYTYSQPTNGTVVVGLDGSWVYTRVTNLLAVDTDSFTVTIDDSAGQLVDLGLGHPYAPNGHTVTYTVHVNYDGLL